MHTDSTKETKLDLFFRAAFSIDMVMFTYHEGRLKILLKKSEEPPYKGFLCIPGKLIYPNEDTGKALDQMMLSLLGIEGFYKKQLRAFTDVGRHPLGRVITIGYYGLINEAKIESPLSEELMWHTLEDLPELSYDHNRIVRVALRSLRKGLLRHPIVFELLPPKFTLTELREVYEQAFGKELDTRNFRRQAKDSDLIIPLNEKRVQVGQMGKRPQLYRFDHNKYNTRGRETIGFNF